MFRWTGIIFVVLISGSLFSRDFPILFTKQVNNNDSIYLYTAGGKLHQVTDHPRKDSTPMLSADGRLMVFTSERVGWWKIWLLDLSERSFKQLTNSDNAEYAPCWSPRGHKIAYVSSRDRNYEIYVMNTDGSQPYNLSQNPGNDNLPFWGHDNKIYYSSQIDGVFQIVCIDPDGKNKKILTTDKGNKYMPQVSPAGKSILFYSDIEDNYEIYTMATDGSGRQRLTQHSLLDIRPRWSPDGKKIVFERGDKQKNQQIYVMNRDGSTQTQLTFSDYNYSPSFVTNCDFLCPGDENQVR